MSPYAILALVGALAAVGLISSLVLLGYAVVKLRSDPPACSPSR